MSSLSLSLSFYFRLLFHLFIPSQRTVYYSTRVRTRLQQVVTFIFLFVPRSDDLISMRNKNFSIALGPFLPSPFLSAIFLAFWPVPVFSPLHQIVNLIGLSYIISDSSSPPSRAGNSIAERNKHLRCVFASASLGFLLSIFRPPTEETSFSVFLSLFPAPLGFSLLYPGARLRTARSNYNSY